VSFLYSSHAARNIGAKLEVEMLDTWLLADMGITVGDEGEGFLDEDVPATGAISTNQWCIATRTNTVIAMRRSQSIFMHHVL
jgi:hypothetical protein